jgi:hypothetical protein
VLFLSFIIVNNVNHLQSFFTRTLMKNNTIENIIENQFYFLPFFHRKLLKTEPPEIKPLINLSRILWLK